MDKVAIETIRQGNRTIASVLEQVQEALDNVVRQAAQGLTPEVMRAFNVMRATTQVAYEEVSAICINCR